MSSVQCSSHKPLNTWNEANVTKEMECEFCIKFEKPKATK